MISFRAGIEPAHMRPENASSTIPAIELRRASTDPASRSLPEALSSMSSPWSNIATQPTRLRQRLRQRHAAAIPAAVPAIVPVIAAPDDLSAAIERRLRPTALRARAGCPIARDALYLALHPKLDRFIRRVRVPMLGDDRTGIWDRDDVEQEAFLVFIELLDQWETERPFGRYIVATFPWRLRDAIYRGIGRRGVPTRMALVSFDDLAWLRDGSAAAAEATVLLGILAEHLPALQAEILRRHIGEGDTLTAIARDLDLSRRTVTRQWRAARDHLAGEIATTQSRRRMA
jgi:RNA polymerase sigma factor (sigma-70 family)